MPERLHSTRHLIGVFVGYLLLATAVTYPLVLHGRTALPHDVGDPVLNTWILWWDAVTVPFTDAWWQAPAFAPARDVLAFSEHLLGLAPLSAPVQWLTGNPVLAYNVVFLLSYALSGFAAYVLALEVTGRRDAAWVAGVVFAFPPYRVEQVSHLQVLAAFGMPFALAALHAFVRSGRVRFLMAFAVATLVQGLVNGYYLLFFPVLVAVWVVWFVADRAGWARAVAIAIAGAVATALSLPVLLRYQAVHARYGFARGMEEISGFSADLTSLLSASDRLRLWSFVHAYTAPEGQLFPGLTAPLLVLAGLVLVRGGPRASTRVWRIVRLVLLAAATLLGAAFGAYAWFGPWRISLLGMQISVTQGGHVLAQLLVALALLLASSPRLVDAWRRHSSFGFYCVGAGLMWVLALGPRLAWRGTVILEDTPYRALMSLPGFDGLRVPARFWMLALVCLSAASALAYARLVRQDWRWRGALVGALTLLALSDSWMGAMPMIDVPPRSALLEAHAAYPLVELPLGNNDDDLAAMYRSIYHRQPVANGYSGYPAPHYAALGTLLADRDPRILARLASLGIRDVRVTRARDPGGRLRAFVAEFPGTTLVGEDGPEALFRLPATPADDTRVVLGAPVPIAALDANVRPDLLENLQDGNRGTRWETGPQTPGHELRIALARATPLGAVVLDLGPSLYDFPRGLEIDLSIDGETWTRAWEGTTALLAFDAGLADPRHVPLAFPLGGRTARYIRLRQTGTDPVFYWSATEVGVFSP